MTQPFRIRGKIKLKDFEPDFTDNLDKPKTKVRTNALCRRIGELQHLLYANAKNSLVVLFQGMDASGKDGASKRVLEFVNPCGVETTSFKTPSREESAHDFLWRVHKAVPRYGNIGVFNRSHYEEVLIVRVLKLRPESVWKPRYDDINAFEKNLTRNGVILLKFFLHISKREQADRFRDRLKTPSKRWKFSTDDLRMRAHWDDFQKAYEDALNRCSTDCAPWHIVPADHKWYRDYMIAKTVVESLENLKMKWPVPLEKLSKIRIT